MKENNVIQEAKPILSVNKWKFITWLFIITIIMLFASQTSAYLVRRAEGNWVEFELPIIFWISTGVLILSSIFMHLSLISARKDELGKLKMFVSLTFLLGTAFLIMQYMGWQQLDSEGVYLKGNPSESFMYVLTGLHAFHLVTGLGVLLYTFIAVMRDKVDSQNVIQIEVSATYWHFLDILWVYLFFFLLYFR